MKRNKIQLAAVSTSVKECSFIGKIKVLELLYIYKGKLIDQAYKTANMKCTLNLKTNSKTETSTFNRSGENEGQNLYRAKI